MRYLAPTNESTQVSEQSARRGYHHRRKKQIRKFHRLRYGFSRTYIVPTIRPQCFKVCLNCECVCFLPMVSSLGLTHFSLAALPRRAPPFNSQQAQRQTGQADCSKQQLEPGGERKGRDLLNHKHTASGHQWTDTPRSEGVYFIWLTMLL